MHYGSNVWNRFDRNLKYVRRRFFYSIYIRRTRTFPAFSKAFLSYEEVEMVEVQAEEPRCSTTTYSISKTSQEIGLKKSSDDHERDESQHQQGQCPAENEG